MKIEEQVASLELSKELAELGLKVESLFVWREIPSPLMNKPSNHKTVQWTGPKPRLDDIPAYTVAELGELLPSEIKGESTVFTLQIQNYYGEWCLWYENEFGDHTNNMYFSGDSIIRCMEQVPISLIKEGHVTVEELNQEKGR